MNVLCEQLRDDIRRLGMPVIMLQSFALTLKVQPERYKEDETNISFFDRDGFVATVGKHYAKLVEKDRPDNYVQNCRKCYSVQCVETGTHIAWIFWPG